MHMDQEKKFWLWILTKPLKLVFDKVKRTKNQKMNEMLNKTLRMSFRD